LDIAIQKNREEAVFKLQTLIDQHIAHHVTDSHRFKDSDSLYYRFFEDETAAVLKSEKEVVSKVSVTELLSGCHGVTQHGNVDIKGFFGWSTRYLALRADEGILYIFENEIAPAPKEEVYVGDTSLLKEVLDLRKGWYCWTLTTATTTYTLSTEKSKDQEAWINALANAGCRFDKEETSDGSHKSIFEFSALNIDGVEYTSLSQYTGSVCLIVNVASQWGLTQVNYTQLQPIYEKYKSQGFVILGFPCNQFGSQEPGTNAEIKAFAAKFGTTWPVFAKINVNGSDAHPIYKFLKSQLTGTLGSSIKWNFTKFLCDRNGKPFKRYGPPSKPQELVPDIEELLKTPIPEAPKAAEAKVEAPKIESPKSETPKIESPEAMVEAPRIDSLTITEKTS